ncbi:hypothetical protein FRB99_002280 [Tulasnella sp. 403]|nr:hypothetical protein FRB99_002280 [Tulasnella sp. 403]
MSPKDVPTAKANPNAAASVAPTPQNTPLVTAPIAQLARPTIPDTIAEGDGEREFDVSGIQKALSGLNLGDAGLSAGIEDLPLPVRRRVEGLKGVHAEFIKIEKQYKKDLLELDRAYAQRYAPVFQRRNAIVTGEAEPTKEEIDTGEAQTLKDDPDAETLASQEADANADVGAEVKGVPLFWLTALKNHPDISQLITTRDEAALVHLTNIELEYLAASSPGYKLTFHFMPNDFFTNTILTKTYHYQDEVDYAGDYVYASAEGTKIDWKEDMDLTKTFEMRKQRNKNTNRTRLVKRTLDTPSFFDFFSPPTPPNPDQYDESSYSEEKLDELEAKLEVDYQVGEDLKERVIPRAIDYFTGKALDYEEAGFSEDDEDEDDVQWEDDDTDQSDDLPLKARKKVMSGTTTQAPECKQQ